MVKNHLTCPSCTTCILDLSNYESMMVLSKNTALFSLTCPHCSKKISSICAIPLHLQEEVRFAAIELDAGMGGERR